MKRLFILGLAAAMAAVLAAPAVAQDMEEVELELPEAFFGGTPLDYWSPNLEPMSFKPRDPFMAPPGAENVALEKDVTASAEPDNGELSQLVDGDKSYQKKSLIELPAGVQWIQVDLGQQYNIHGLLLWHFHEGNRVYFDIVAQASDDANFEEGVVTLYNNDADNSAGLGVGEDKEYIETNKGRLIEVEEDVQAQYVRLYSNGNTANDMNHYVELEVYGTPVQ